MWANYCNAIRIISSKFYYNLNKDREIFKEIKLTVTNNSLRLNRPTRKKKRKRKRRWAESKKEKKEKGGRNILQSERKREREKENINDEMEWEKKERNKVQRKGN